MSLGLKQEEILALMRLGSDYLDRVKAGVINAAIEQDDSFAVYKREEKKGCMLTLCAGLLRIEDIYDKKSSIIETGKDVLEKIVNRNARVIISNAKETFLENTVSSTCDNSSSNQRMNLVVGGCSMLSTKCTAISTSNFFASQDLRPNSILTCSFFKKTSMPYRWFMSKKFLKSAAFLRLANT